jgi:predicted phosphodiesterase
MHLQISSDLHLDLSNINSDNFHNVLTPISPYLALVGDIAEEKNAIYYKFLEWTATKYEHIFLILGNHKYYQKVIKHKNKYNTNSNMDTVYKRVKLFCEKYPNIHLLNNDEFVVSIDDVNYHILGTTLWSMIPKKAAQICEISMNDYHLIPNFYVNSSNKLHIESVIWLTRKLDEIVKKYQTQENNIKYKVVVLSHHAPILNGVPDPKYETPNRELNFAFCSDLKHPINVWIYGHTHWCADFYHEKVRIVSNCLGYKDEHNFYKKDKIIIV